MTMYVLVHIPTGERNDITDSPFEVHEDFTWIEVSADELSEDTYFDAESGAIVDPQAREKTLEETYNFLKSDLKSLRNFKITEGFMIPNTPFRMELTETTERRLTASSAKAKEALAAGLEFNVDWEIDDDNWVVLPAENLIALADLAALHIQSCYTNHKLHFTNIKTLYDSNDQQGLLDYDSTTGW